MGNVVYLDDRKPGLKLHTPEMGDRKPNTRMEATLGHYGKHYYIDTTEELKGRGIEFLRTYTERDLTKAGSYKVGWKSYCVTSRAFEQLRQKYPISVAMHLD